MSYAQIMSYMSLIGNFWHFLSYMAKWSIWHIPYDSHIYANMGVDWSVRISGIQYNVYCIDVTMSPCNNGYMWHLYTVWHYDSGTSIQCGTVTDWRGDIYRVWHGDILTYIQCDNVSLWHLFSVTICHCDIYSVWQCVTVTSIQCDNVSLWHLCRVAL